LQGRTYHSISILQTSALELLCFSYPALERIEEKTIKTTTLFPYVPGFLSFREIPALLKVWERLETKPDVLLVDGHGIAHPRRLGIASHFGVITDTPTIGCAKSKLVGNYKEPLQEAGSYSDVTHNRERIAIALRTKNNVKPIIVSPGHRTTFEDAFKIVMHSVRGYRIPEPTRQVHLLVNTFRRGDLVQ
jgi:deoxyribonuclease V